MQPKPQADVIETEPAALRDAVQRLADEHPEQTIMSLSGIQCACATMYRIDPPHLLWALENLVEGNVVNPIMLTLADLQTAAANELYESMLIGIIGGPLGMLAGGTLGAAAGGLWAKLRDIGIEDDHMKEMGERILPGENLLFLLLDRIDQGIFLREMRRFDAELFESTASDHFDEQVEQALAVQP